MKTLFSTDYSYSGLSAKVVAQKTLEGFTHYVDESTLKFFNCKIVKCSVMDEGKILGLIEHLPVDGFNAPKAYRFTFFTVDGMGFRGEYENVSFKTKAQAEKAFWIFANSLDANTIYKNAIDSMIKWRKNEIVQLQELLK